MKLRDFLHAPYSQEQLDSEVTLTPPVVEPEPVDCVLSDWTDFAPITDWSECVNGQQTRVESRHRTVITEPANGGAPCGPLVETRTVTQACTVDPPTDPVLIVSRGQNQGGPLSACSPDLIDHIDISRLPPNIPFSTFKDSTLRMGYSCNGEDPAWYYKLPVYGLTTNLYCSPPALLDVNGNPEIWHVKPEFGDVPTSIMNGLRLWTMMQKGVPAIPYPTRPGERGHAIFTPYTTWHGHTRIRDDGTVATSPHIPMWIGVTMDGWISYAMRDGSMQMPFRVPFTEGSYVNDLAQYEPHRQIFFYLDSQKPDGTWSLMRVDRTTSPWTVTEFASDTGVAKSVRAIGDQLFVSDVVGNRIFKIDGTTGTKSVLCNIPKPFWLDYDSQGRLVVMTDYVAIHKVDTTTGAVGPNLRPNSSASRQWVQCSVDRGGHMGQKDTIWWCYSIGGAGNIVVVRLSPNGVESTPTSSFGMWGIGNVHTCIEPFGHYMWTVAIHPDEGAGLFQGFSAPNPSLIIPITPEKPWGPAWNHAFHGEGDRGDSGNRFLCKGGPVAGQYPSFSAFMSIVGDSFLGCSADHFSQGITNHSDRAAFIRQGMIGSVPRNFSNADVKMLGAYLLANSQRYITEGDPLVRDWQAYMDNL